MQYQIISYKQNTNNFIAAVLPFELVNKHSHVLIYDKQEGGYQREPDSKHINNIKKYILENYNFMFPTSIILGVDNNLISSLITKIDEIEYIDFEPIFGQKLFRIVDGQHRLRGLAEAAKVNPSINMIDINVVILLTPPESRSIEMEIFNTINSKSKRIKVDLIQLARYEYRILENVIQPSEINEHISIQVANLLNEDNSQPNVWFNAIKFGIHDEQKVGIIGVNAFKESLRNVVNRYLQLNNQYLQLRGADLINYSKTAATKIKEFVFIVWNEIVFEKWNKCFSPKNQELDFDLEIKEFYYNSKYYIQKTLGTKAINYLLGNLVSENGNLLDAEVLQIFKSIIDNSELLTSDWEVGKTFSGYSSESAFNKVSKMIKSELPVFRS